MPSAEECIEARNDVEKRCVNAFVAEGHHRHSAQEIVKYMSYEQQCKKIGQITGEPYSPY